MSKKKDNIVETRQYMEIFSSRFVQEMLLDCFGIGISWWLTSNRMVYGAMNDKFDLSNLSLIALKAIRLLVLIVLNHNDL